MTDHERAPVQGDIGWQFKRPGARRSGTIDWAEHLMAWDAYSEQYGTSQSPERLAERGGFCYDELTGFLGHEPTTWEPRSG